MEMWFSELHTPNVKISIRIDKQLYSAQSDYQRIDVFDSPEMGRFVTLDGDIIFSQADEFVYNEMVTHVPMSVHPNVKKVLIIGGGDGGVAREYCRYPEVEVIDVVESDDMFVDVCKQFFPETAKGFEDPRVNIYYEDGLKFLRKKINEYDIIVNDSTDPFGHTEGLFTKEFYGNCYKALKKTVSWFISMEARFMMKMRWRAAVCIGRRIVVFLSVVFIRLIFPPVRPDIGYLALPPRSIIR